MRVREGPAAPRCRHIPAQGPPPVSSRRLRQLLGEGERWAQEIADRLEASGHVDYRECVGPAERCDLLPAKRCRDRSTPNRTNAVGPCRRLRPRVLQVIDVDPPPLRLTELERDELRQPLSCELTYAKRERAAVLKRVPASDRNKHVDPTGPRRLREADQTEVVEHVLDGVGDLLHVVP